MSPIPPKTLDVLKHILSKHDSENIISAINSLNLDDSAKKPYMRNDEELERFTKISNKLVETWKERSSAPVLHEINDILERMMVMGTPMFPFIIKGSLSKYESLSSKKPRPRPPVTGGGTEGNGGSEGNGETEEQDEIDKILTALCTATGDSFTFTIYVDQPVEGEPTASTNTGDVGHTFINISGGGQSATLGWYPEDGIGLGNFLDGTYDDDQDGGFDDDQDGGFDDYSVSSDDDTMYEWDVKKSWKIDKKKMEAIKEFIKKWKKSKKYNLLSSRYDISFFENSFETLKDLLLWIHNKA